MRIIYSVDGFLADVRPSVSFLDKLNPEWTLEEKMIYLANKDLPTGTKYELVDDSVIQADDTTFRDAWEYVSDPSVEKISEDLSAEDLAKHNKKRNRQIDD